MNRALTYHNTNHPGLSAVGDVRRVRGTGWGGDNTDSPSTTTTPPRPVTTVIVIVIVVT